MTNHSTEISWGPLLRDIREFYAQGSWRVPVLRNRGTNPFRVLVSTLLSHRTRDEVTQRAAQRLLRSFPTPTQLAKAPLAKIESLIRDTGLAEQKARGLQAAARAIVEDYQGTVPHSERDLLNLPRVGPKTARAVLVFGFETPALPVDTHIHRVVNRLGVVSSKSPEETSDRLRTIVPRRYWKEVNPVLVQHGQNLCASRNPHCGVCPISDRCAKVGLS